MTRDRAFPVPIGADVLALLRVSAKDSGRTIRGEAEFLICTALGRSCDTPASRRKGSGRPAKRNSNLK